MSIVLKVNNRAIDSSEIIPLLAGYQLLPKLLRELIIDEAISGFSYSLNERKQAYQRFYAANRLADEQQRQAWLKHYGLTAQQLEALVTRDLKIEKFKQATWGAKLESYFLQHKSKLDQVIYSFVRTTDVKVAQELYFRLNSGEQSFAELVQADTQAAHSLIAGQAGPVTFGQIHPALAQMLADGQAGQLYSPIQIEQWQVIIRLEQLIPAQWDESMRQQLLDALFEAWLNEQMKQLKTAQPLP